MPLPIPAPAEVLKPLLSVLSPAGARACLSILLLHRVLRQPDRLLHDEFDAARFDNVCRWLRDWFVVLPLDEAVQRLRDGALPARAAAISFDDGYADNHDVALPILQRHGLSAAFFVATGFLDGGRMFNDSVIEILRRTTVTELDLRDTVLGDLGVRQATSIAARRALIDDLLPRLKPQPGQVREAFCAQLQRIAGVPSLPDDLMMSSAQVQALRRSGMVIGAHTVNHPILAALDEAAAEREIRAGRDALEGLLDERVGLFAYPNGRPGADYGPANVAMVRAAGFDAAFTTAWGAARAGCDMAQLPRFTPWDRTRLRFGLRMAGNLRRRPDAVRPPQARPIPASAT